MFAQRWFFFILVSISWIISCSQQPNATKEPITESGSEVLVESVPEEQLTRPDESVSSPEDAGDGSVTTEPKPEFHENGQESPPQPEQEPISESVTDVAEKTPPISKNVDSSGGRVCHEHVCVEISAQAMAQRTLTVVFQQPQQAAPKGSVAPPMDVGPDNWKPKGSMFVIFQKIQVPSGIKPEQLRVAFVEKNRWHFVQTTYDSQQNEWKGQTTHFSVWGLVVQGQSCQSHGDCYDAEQCNQGTCQAPSCQTDQNCQTDEYCSQNLKICFKAPPCRSKPDICNGVDDDCNGIPDEGCPLCRTSQECGAKHECQRGVCLPQCPPDQIICTDQCTSVFLDSKNCGACGVICTNTQQCVAGACVP